jgi:hypothetical protein
MKPITDETHRCTCTRRPQLSGSTALSAPLWLGLAILGACGSEQAATAREPHWKDEEPLAYGPCAAARRVGAFSVELSDLYTAASGNVAEAVVAADVPELVRELGDCRLERQRNLFCDPPCGGGATCGEGNACVPYPENIDVGEVSLWGLAEAVHMQADASGRRYWHTKLPHPGFQTGADIHLQAEGGELTPFTLRGFGVSALETPDTTLELESEQAFDVAWTAAHASPARVLFTLSIDQHGVTPLSVVCEVGDTGSLSVPAPLVTALFDAGPSGFPSARLERRSADSTMLEHGCVEFTVRATAKLSVDVSGHMPCARDEDCLAAGRCNIETGTCE